MANPTIICGQKLADSSHKRFVEEIQETLWDVGSVGPDNPFWESNVARRNRIMGPNDLNAKNFWIDGDPGEWTKEALIHFQLRHLGPDKIPLDETEKLGTVGMETWWALENNTGVAQRQWLSGGAGSANNLGNLIVKVWEHYIGLGLREIPLGSNRGPILPGLGHSISGGIDVWTGFRGKTSSVKGPAWCCWSRTGIEKEAHAIRFGGGGNYFQGRTGLCYGNYQWGKKKGFAVDKADVLNGSVKLPVGTAMIMNYGGTRGHTGTVAGIEYDNAGRPVKIYTREGNISDRGGRRVRQLAQSTIKWFVIAPELIQDDPDYVGVLSKAKTAGNGERTI